jgi:tRNA A37 methylthiotransferase MiaB
LHQSVGYEQAFMFAYSLREKTHAHRNYADNVPPFVKNRRLQEVIATFRHFAHLRNQAEVGLLQVVLIDGVSKRDPHLLTGRSHRNRKGMKKKRFWFAV